MQNSKYAPISVSEFGAKDLNAALQGTNFIAIATQTTIKDYKVEHDYILDGAEISVVGVPLIGDYLKGQVVDVDNVFGYGAGLVLGEFVPKWMIVPGLILQLSYESKYPAKIYAGLYIRTIYYSLGLSNLDVIANYKLHKVLW